MNGLGRSRSLANRLWIYLIALTPMVAAAAPTFTLTEIPLPVPAQPGQHALVPTAINSSGQVTGTVIVPAGGYHAFLFSGGVLQDLGTLNATGNGNIVAVASGMALNDSGTVVGSLVDGTTDEFSQGFIYANGTMSVLTNPAGEALCSPSGINTDGLIVGSCWSTGHGLIYMNGAGQEQNGVGVFYGVNNAGQVVGMNGDSKAVLYESGAYSLIPELSGQQFASSAATGINNAGEVVGISKKATGSGNYLLWTYSNGTTQPLPAVPDNCNGISTCYGGAPNAHINNAGQVIWTSVTAPNTQPVFTPFFIADGSVMDLNTLISPEDPNAPFVTLLEANGINDNGWIVATGMDSRTHVTGGYLLTPVTPFPPALRVQAPANATAGTAFSVTWTNQGMTACTASGGATNDGWAGTVSIHGGQQQVTEGAAGTYTYTLTCDTAAAPMTASAKVAVAGNSGGAMQGGMSGSSGGGGMDFLTLMGLIAALTRKIVTRALRSPRARLLVFWKLVGREGFEPSTKRLRVSCSTN